MAQRRRPRVIVYVDGFNFYYGALRNTSLKWLDYRKLAETLLRDHRIDQVKYFTSRVRSRPDNPGLSQRQDDYIRALIAHSGVKVFLGQFKRRHKRRPLADNRASFVTIADTEEKGSDVSFGSHLVWDACHGFMEVALVLSNDSDLQTPVQMAEKKGVKVVTVNPHQQSEQPRRLLSSDKRTLQTRHLRRSQLPSPVMDEKGRRIHKPKEWL